MSALPLNASLTGKNTFCGPAALAALLNCSTDRAATAIRHISRQTAVKGAYTGHVVRVIKANGGEVAPTKYPGHQPIVKYAPKRPMTLTVVECTSGGQHFMLVRRGKVLDSISRAWVPATEHRHRYAKVLSAHEITKIPTLPKAPKRKRKTAAEKRAAAERRAEKAARAERDRKVIDAALVVIKAGPKTIEEICLSETGRWEDAGQPDEGQVVSAINRSPAGKICFNSIEEVEDAIWALETGTAFYDEPHKRHLVDRIAGYLDRRLRQNTRKAATAGGAA